MEAGLGTGRGGIYRSEQREEQQVDVRCEHILETNIGEGRNSFLCPHFGHSLQIKHFSTILT